MDFKLHSHRNALEIVESRQYRKDWISFCEVISSVNDDDLKAAFRALGASRAGRRKVGQKSLSHAINEVLRMKLKALGWVSEPTLFSKDKAGSGPNAWKLDFVRRKPGSVSGHKACSYAVEVAFNHSEAAAWVLTKLALACEPTSMAKEVEATVGILVVMQADLKRAGNFDSACCTYDRYLHTIGVMNDLLRAPLIVVGLGAPRTFRLKGYPRGVRIVGVIEDV